MIELGAALIKLLEQYQIKFVFGIPGSHTLPFFHALSKSKKIKHVLTKHESSAAFMALSYTRVKGDLCACIGTVGPGATNLITGVAEAYRSCIPMLVLTVQTPLSFFGKNAFQESSGSGNTIDQVKLLSCVTKKSILIENPEEFVALTRDAIYLALRGRRGPVHICIPADLFRQEIEWEIYSNHRNQHYRLAPEPDHDAISRCIDKIAKAQRPAFVLGVRCCYPNAADTIEKIGRDLGIPMITTLAAKGMVDESQRYSLGTLDTFGHKLAEKYLKTCDLVFTFGEDFGEYSTLYWDPDLLPQGGLIQVDVDDSEFNRNYAASLNLEGEIIPILTELYRGLKKIGCKKHHLLDEAESLKKNLGYYSEEESFKKSVPLKPQHVFMELRKNIPRDFKIFVDVGAHGWWAARYFMAYKNAYFTCYGMMSMGSAVSGSLGGACALPGEKIICICGDGCFLMNGMEINTAANYGLNVVWVVFNDGKLNAIDITQKLTYGNLNKCCHMSNPDFSKLAAAFGLEYVKVEKSSDFARRIPKLLRAGSRAIVDIYYDDEELLPIKPRTMLSIRDLGLVKTLHDGPYAGAAFSKLLKER